jgi:WD40 repeat protein
MAALLGLTGCLQVGLMVFLLVLLQHAEERAAAVQNLKQAKHDLAEMQHQADLARQETEEQKKLTAAEAKLADDKRREGERIETKAKQVALEAQHTQYAADMQYAAAAWEADNVPQMADLLMRYLPAPGGQDVRGFEWHYLWQQTQQATRNWQAFPPPPAQANPLFGDDTPLLPLRLALSKDGKYLAVLRQDFRFNQRRQGTSFENVVKLWDVAGGVEVATLPSFDGAVLALDFAEDGQHLRCLVFRDEGQKLRQEYAKDMEKRASVSQASLLAPLAALTGSGTGLWPTGDARASAAFLVALMHELHVPLKGGPPVERGCAPLEHWPAHMNFGSFMLVMQYPPGVWTDKAAYLPVVFAMAPDGRTLAMGGLEIELFYDATATNIQCVQRYWDLKSDRPGKATTFDEDLITAIAYSPSGALLATASLDGTVRLWDTAASGEQLGFRRPWSVSKQPGKPRLSFRAHPAMIPEVRFAGDGKYLLTTAANGTVKLWDPATGQLHASFKGHKDIVCDALLTPDGRTLITADTTGLVKFWDTAGSFGPRVLKGPKGNVLALQFTPDSRTLVCVGNKGKVQGFDVVGRRRHFAFDLFSKPPGVRMHAAALSADGHHVLAGAYPLQMFDAFTGKEIALGIDPQQAMTSSFALSLDGKRLAVLDTAKEENEIRVFERASGAVVFTAAAGKKLGSSLAFGPGGQLLALFDTSGQILLWDVETGKKIHTLPLSSSARAVPLVFSPDGSMLAASDGKAIYLFDTRTGQKVWQAPTYWHHPSALVFSSDGQRLASAGGGDGLEVGGGVKLWDVATGRELLTLGSRNQQFAQVAFSPDRTKLAAVSAGSLFGATQADPAHCQISIWEVPGRE